MLRRLLLAIACLALAVAATAGPAAAGDGDAEGERLPGTTLEAAERDDGTTSVAPWVIGSGIVALVLIGAGGIAVQRRGR